MSVLILYIIVLLLVSWAVAASVYRKQVREKKSPWTWSIVAFLLTIVLFVGAAYLLVMYFFSFER